MGKGEGHGMGVGEGHGVGQGQGLGKGLKETLTVCGTCCIIVIVVLVVIGLSGIGIAKIVMGAIYIHDCPIQYLIPIWLIVSGCSPILLSVLSRANQKNDGEEGDASEDKKPKCNIFTMLGTLGVLFNFAWLICGTVWVAGNWSTVNDGCPGRNDCCNLTLMKFALAMLIIDWILIAILIIVICCVCVVVICVATKGSDDP